MSVTKLDYDEKSGVLTVSYSSGASSAYLLVPPKVYEESYGCKNLDAFVSHYLAGRFPQTYKYPKQQER